ncbi:MAG TPA: CHAT domain-containing tetratricopeptide repeat protein [Puia sp.]|jgi:CHAT domain-containing protein
MYGRSGILILISLLFTSLDFGYPGDPAGPIRATYRKANALFSLPNSTPANDSTTLALFERLTVELQRSPDFNGKDTLQFQCWLKKGVLLDARYDYAGAKAAYCKALTFPQRSDSLSYVTRIYIGTSYYNLHHFDSARYFLLNAESQVGRFHDQDDEVRLYNTLGALFYDNGNYRQGKNYFSRALEIVNGRRPFDTVSAVSLGTNIATSFYHLGLYRESLEMYNKILAYHIFADYIYLNMGMAYASLDKYPEAMACFRKVNVKKMPRVFNEMGYAQFRLNRPDSSAWCLDHLLAPENAVHLNDVDLETNDLYRADLLAGQRQWLASLKSLQKAILICSRSFHNPDIFSNPSSFTGTFATYRLFDALFKKAQYFRQLFGTEPKEEYLKASFATYQAALSLLRYIEKSYDTDDAKLFLKKRNGAACQGAVSVCLDLYRLHPGDDYLEQAFMISEKNKASVITANLEERIPGNIPAKEQGLLQDQRNIKYNIARLNVRSEEATDKKEAERIAGEKTGYEIELARLQKELERNGNYYQRRYDDSTPGIEELQRHLDGKQALISFYMTPATLHVFILTRSSFAYTHVDSLATLQEEVKNWLHLLTETGNGRKFRGAATGDRLSQLLIQPIRAMIPDKEEWIIIPDGSLYFLPFESLPASKGGDPLLMTTTISYQFSSRLLLTPPSTERSPAAINPSAASASSAADKDHSRIPVLAFAPFTKAGSGNFPRLPASGEEIAGLAGRSYTDSAATKAQFLREINLHEIDKYPIVHLATHAVSSADDVSASFIAFYPKKGSSIEDRLFLEELYGLDMHNTRLVIISACETGQGELVSSEGVISLARAFAYAGCASTVSSLWKADDRSTSFILRRFYAYLQKGYTKSKALRQAKLDYLGSDAINKSPAYWAHLMLMGNTEPLYDKGSSYKWLLIAALVIGTGILFWMLLVMRNVWKRKNKKSTLFTDVG